MPRILNIAAVAALVLGVASCSSDASKVETTTARTTAPSTSPDTSPDSAPQASTAPTGTESESTEATTASPPASEPESTEVVTAPPASEASTVETETPPTEAPTTAPAGDGHWHPTTHSSEAPLVPDIVAALLDGQPVTSLGAAAEFYEPRAFAISLASTCADVQAAMTAKAAADEIPVVANGADAASGWFVVQSSIVDGANLALTAGADPTTCDISGVPLTPARLTFDGPVAATVTAAAAIDCGVGFNGGITLSIWGLPIGDAAGTTATLFITTSDGTQPGVHQVGAGEPGDDLGLLTTNGPWTFQQMAAVVLNLNGDETPPGYTRLKGAVTLADGLASGSLDVSDGNQHISGTFACGTPIVEDAPPTS